MPKNNKQTIGSKRVNLNETKANKNEQSKGLDFDWYKLNAHKQMANTCSKGCPVSKAYQVPLKAKIERAISAGFKFGLNFFMQTIIQKIDNRFSAKSKYLANL